MLGWGDVNHTFRFDGSAARLCTVLCKGLGNYIGNAAEQLKMFVISKFAFHHRLVENDTFL
jgi:hypothetical protein